MDVDASGFLWVCLCVCVCVWDKMRCFGGVREEERGEEKIAVPRCRVQPIFIHEDGGGGCGVHGSRHGWSTARWNGRCLVKSQIGDTVVCCHRHRREHIRHLPFVEGLAGETKQKRCPWWLGTAPGSRPRDGLVWNPRGMRRSAPPQPRIPQNPRAHSMVFGVVEPSTKSVRTDMGKRDRKPVWSLVRGWRAGWVGMKGLLVERTRATAKREERGGNSCLSCLSVLRETSAMSVAMVADGGAYQVAAVQLQRERCKGKLHHLTAMARGQQKEGGRIRRHSKSKHLFASLHLLFINSSSIHQSSQPATLIQHSLFASYHRTLTRDGPKAGTSATGDFAKCSDVADKHCMHVPTISKTEKC
ncbi:hypothetical protein QBC39DRAFT_147099 [Podospora conica]|nr:hypothetical protein QBC39DRAFT_147099 [Schizothecium conicum]